MHKIFLIIKREYLTRVRKKTFIITTLLFPLLYIGLVFGTGFLADKTRANLNVAVIDSSGFFTKELLDKQNTLDNSSTLTLVKNNSSEKEFNYDSAGFDAYLVIPALDWQIGNSNIELRAKKSYGPGSTALIDAKLNRVWDEIKNDSLKIDSTKQQILLSSRLGIHFTNITDPKANAKFANSIGLACGFLIYFIILIYGSQVMMGVMEEKTNRIAEIIVSSVKPFQMMLGKIIGIALVALTQFLLWIAFVFIIYNITKVSGNGNSVNSLVGGVQQIFTSINLPMILFCFGFYFLAGFFFYSSIYGAVGSAVNEDVREAQSLSFPITMLIIISIVMMSAAVNDPTGPIAFWGSIIPFSSPIVMMARIPYGVPGTVPWWQLGLSMALLIGGFIFTTWFAGKIYRTGILMYGKKPSWKELIKWAFRKS
ncbi:MAG: ABC transporter permease [Bacteroidetes bacterium]|nr:ABC transporter permease [Bacteroidota bacterium]MBS1929668.1 ABC transporter permease [Bacteroidota bacterium]